MRRRVGKGAAVTCAAAGVALAGGLAAWVVLGTGGQPGAAAEEAPDGAEAPASAQLTGDGGADPVAGRGTAIGNAGYLDLLDDGELAGLESALRAWEASEGVGPDADVEAIGPAIRTAIGKSAFLHVAGVDAYLTAQLSATGSWSVVRLEEDLPGIDAPDASAYDVTGDGAFDSDDVYESMALVSQLGALARHVPKECADGLEAGMEAAGIRTGGAWVDVSTVRTDGDATSFELFVPTYLAGGEGREAWRATWRQGAGFSFERSGEA